MNWGSAFLKILLCMLELSWLTFYFSWCSTFLTICLYISHAPYLFPPSTLIFVSYSLIGEVLWNYHQMYVSHNCLPILFIFTYSSWKDLRLLHFITILLFSDKKKCVILLNWLFIAPTLPKFNLKKINTTIIAK